MSWIKKIDGQEEIVNNEMESDFAKVSESNAYAAKITDAHLQESAQEGSKSVSLVLGRDGNPFYINKKTQEKKYHFGLLSANTLFQLALNKSLFDVEPDEVEYKQWDNEKKEMIDIKGDGFSGLIGKDIGITVQMHRKIDGQNSSEWGEIEHFFDLETNLFSDEVAGSKKSKLEKWLSAKKDFKVEVVEAQASSFGKKKETAEGEAPKPSRWGSKA